MGAPKKKKEKKKSVFLEDTFFLFTAVPVAYGSSHDRGQIGAIAEAYAEAQQYQIRASSDSPDF